MNNRHPVINRVQMGLFYFCLSSFFLGIAVQEGSLALFLFFELFIAMVYRRSNVRLLGKGYREAFVFMSVLLLTAAISQLRNNDEYTRLHWALIAIWGISPTLLPRINWKLLHRTMLVVSTPSLLFNLYELLRPEQLAMGMEIGFQGHPRAMGFGSDSTIYAEGLVILMCWSLARLSANQTRKERALILVHLSTAMMILALSRSIAGLIAFSLVLMAAFIFRKNLRKVSFAMLTICLFGFLLAFVFIGTPNRLSERFELARNSLVLALEHPLLGIGPHKFTEHPVVSSDLTQQPHNTLLGLAAESGFLGLAAYLWLMLAIFLRLRVLRSETENPDQHWVLLALAQVYLVWWVFGFFEFNFQSSRLLILHIFHWAIILQWGRFRDIESEPTGT